MLRQRLVRPNLTHMLQTSSLNQTHVLIASNSISLSCLKGRIYIIRLTPHKVYLTCVFESLIQAFMSVNPKISRISRQKRNNEFFLIWPKGTHLAAYFRKWHQKVRFPFLFFRICKTWKFGHKASSSGHETWNLTHVKHARIDVSNVVLIWPLHSLWSIS